MLGLQTTGRRMGVHGRPLPGDRPETLPNGLEVLFAPLPGRFRHAVWPLEKPLQRRPSDEHH